MGCVFAGWSDGSGGAAPRSARNKKQLFAKESVARQRKCTTKLRVQYKAPYDDLLFFFNYRIPQVRRWEIFSTIDSAGQAHQNGCDMTRNIPQPIWCIGPQKVMYATASSNSSGDYSSGSASSSPLYSSAASYPCDPRLILSLNFHDSVLLVVWNTLRTDTILFIKAGCDSRELYDKPTLMVKACPASRQDAREFVFSTNTFHTLLFGHTFWVYKSLRTMRRL